MLAIAGQVAVQNGLTFFSKNEIMLKFDFLIIPRVQSVFSISLTCFLYLGYGNVFLYLGYGNVFLYLGYGNGFLYLGYGNVFLI